MPAVPPPQRHPVLTPQNSSVKTMLLAGTDGPPQGRRGWRGTWWQPCPWSSFPAMGSWISDGAMQLLLLQGPREQQQYSTSLQPPISLWSQYGLEVTFFYTCWSTKTKLNPILINCHHFWMQTQFSHIKCEHKMIIAVEKDLICGKTLLHW